MKQRYCVALFVLFALVTVLISCGGGKQYIDRAEKYIEAQRYNEAIEELDRSLKENPDNTEALFIKGKCYLLNNRFNDAEKQFNKLASIQPSYKKKTASLYVEMGKTFLANNNLGAARHCFNSAIDYNQVLAKPIVKDLFAKAKAITKNLGNASDVKDIFNMIIEYQPEIDMKDTIAEQSYKAGLLYLKNDQINAGLVLIEESTNHDPDYIKKVAKVYMDLAQTAEKSDSDLHVLKRYLNKAVQYDPRYKGDAAKLYFNSARNNVDKDIRMAKLLLDQAISLDPKYQKQGQFILDRYAQETQQ